MLRSTIACLAGLLSAAVGGCGGHYILTVPDQVAPAGGEATTVVRLQRNDFFVLSLAVKEAAMRFQVAGRLERGAYTDKFGYAGTVVPVPAEPGVYPMRVSHLDIHGDEVTAEADAYIWPPDRPAVAVDLDCLPGLWLGDSKDASAALRRLIVEANLIYMTRQSTRHHRRIKRTLAKAGYPKGPVLLWRRQRWHISREGRFKLPRVVIESRLVSQLAELRKALPGLAAGVCDSSLAAKSLAAAGLKVILIGSARPDVDTELIRRDSWAHLAREGL